VQLALCFIMYYSRRGWRRSLGVSVLLLYPTGLGWLGLGLGLANRDDWYLYFAQGILLVASLVVFAFQILADSGAPERRRAQLLARRLADRKDWPADLATSRTLPEVKAFREALRQDVSPALGLLGHPRPQVRIAALSALEFRTHWRPGQAQAVLQVATQAAEPAIRAAALMALANADDRDLVEQLGEFLRDPSWDVRKAAQEALLWDTGTRWTWIRHCIRRALADQTNADDGPLLPTGQVLCAEAVADLTAWSAEKGLLAVRAAQTLAVHYERVLNELPDPDLIDELNRQLADYHSAAPLRLELARLLRDNHLLERPLLNRLIESVNPAPLRLLGAEVLLEEDPGRGDVIATLREVARLPNREIALNTASIVQRLLGVEMGLPVDQPLPACQSRLAAEVTRRVMLWAAKPERPLIEASTSI
jgi:HEAT repeat protein